MNGYKVKILISLMLFVFCATGVFAKAAPLESLILSENSGKYNLVLKTNKVLNFKKEVESDNKVYFEIKNINTEGSIETNYGNAKNIDGVVVQEIAKNKVRIYINGKNAKDTQLLFQTPKGLIEPQKGASGANKTLLVFLALIGVMFAGFKRMFSKIKLEGKAIKQKTLSAQDVAKNTRSSRTQNQFATNPYYDKKNVTINILQQRQKEMFQTTRKSA